VAAEDIGFPFAAQAAQITRQHLGRKEETVGLITDLSPEALPAQGVTNFFEVVLLTDLSAQGFLKIATLPSSFVAE
jgi:hypothetical protein